jgi:hypothetical protein
MRVLPPNAPLRVAVAAYGPDPADDPRAGAEFSASSDPARHPQGMLSEGKRGQGQLRERRTAFN